MKCPRCQQENRPDAKYCDECGTPATGADLAKPHADLKDENEGLRRSLTEALEQQTATGEILRTIAGSPTNLQPVLDALIESAAKLCGARRGVILRRDGEAYHGVAFYNASSELIDFIKRHPVTPGRHTITARVALERRTIHIADLQADPDYRYALRDVEPIRTELGVPMFRGDDDIVGVIILYKVEVQPFTDKQVELVETFADQAVIAIENVRLFKELEARNKDLSEALDQQTATSEILRVISRSPTDVRPVFETILERSATLCEAQLAHLWLYEGGEQFRLGAGYGSRPDHLQWLEQGLHRIGRPFFREIGPWQVGQVLDVRDTEPYRRGEALWIRTVDHEGMRTLLGVPLVKDGRLVGSIAIYRREVRPFTDAQVTLVKTFADQAVIAIENVRLFTELQAKNQALTEAHAQVSEALDQQTSTAEILRVISNSPTDVQPTFEAIASSATKLCEAGDSAVLRFEAGLIHLMAHYDSTGSRGDVIRNMFPMPPGRGSVTARAILTRAVIHIPDIAADPEYQQGAVVKAGFRSVLSVPMLRDDQPVGALTVSRRGVKPFSAGQIALLQTFADQAVIAIENVRLFTELADRNRDLTATSEILRAISTSPTDVQPVLNAIAERAVELCGAYFANVFLVDGDLVHWRASHNVPPEGVAVMRATYPLPTSANEMIPAMLRERRTAIIEDAQQGPEGSPVAAGMERSRVIGLRSWAAVPLLRQGDAIGALAVSRREVKSFSENEIAMLRTFADQAVIAIENVRLFKELETRNRDLTQALAQQTATSDILRVISTSPAEVQTVFEAIARNTVRLCSGVLGAVFRFDGELMHIGALHGYSPEGEEATRRTFPRPPERRMLAGRAILSRAIVHVPDVLADPEFEYQALAAATDWRSLLVIPMLRGGEVLGTVGVAKAGIGPFADQEIALLQTFADQAVIAIENVRLFKELENANRELMAASRHKSEFLANMSHELRTPLNAVIGFSEVLNERMFGELNEKQADYLKDIHASGQHLLSLINDILDLSKIEAGRMELELMEFNLLATLDSALTLVRERAGRHGITLDLTVDERLDGIRADERKVRQVVLNLLSNAIKFTPDGGQIEVRAVPVDGNVEVSVTDTGVGIAPEDQDVIFEEFKQVGTSDKKVEGTGLGLALSRKFVELHGGRIWVKSRVGQGSTFTFTIPMSQDA